MGEELEALKEYKATSKNVIVFGHINSLKVIDISGSERVKNLELSTNENFIKELREVVMTNPKLIGTKNFNEFLKRLPSRKDKDKKGVFKALSPVITQADVDELKAKGWEKIFY